MFVVVAVVLLEARQAFSLDHFHFSTLIEKYGLGITAETRHDELHLLPHVLARGNDVDDLVRAPCELVAVHGRTPFNLHDSTLVVGHRKTDSDFVDVQYHRHLLGGVREITGRTTFVMKNSPTPARKPLRQGLEKTILICR